MPLEILLVEDNAADAQLTREVLAGRDQVSGLHVAIDGDQALAVLRHENGFEEVPRPDIILLDLNLPRRNGHEILSELKGDPELRDIPVVMLSTSHDERDVRESYRRQASSFITKPVDFDEYTEQLHDLETYWSQVVLLPKHQRVASL